MVEQPVLFFDGVCNLCNASVDWLIRRDKEHRLRFAPLQGETATELVPGFTGAEGLSTIVLVDEKGTRVRSAAVIGALIHIGGFWGFMARLALVVPRPLRDWGYRLIAKNRYRMFGEKSSCRLPTPEERAQFLP